MLWFTRTHLHSEVRVHTDADAGDRAPLRRSCPEGHARETAPRWPTSAPRKPEPFVAGSDFFFFFFKEKPKIKVFI